MHLFLHYWPQSLIIHAQNELLHSHLHVFTVFDRSLKYLVPPQAVRLGSLVPLPTPSKAEPRAERKKADVSADRKQKGFDVVYSNGSSKKVHLDGADRRIGGWGWTDLGETENFSRISGKLPQTNSVGELLAAVDACRSLQLLVAGT